LERTFKGDSNGVKINIQLPDCVGKIKNKTCKIKKIGFLDRTFVHGTLDI